MIRMSWIRIRSRSDPRIVLWVVWFRFDFGLVGATTHTLVPFSIGCNRVALKVTNSFIVYLTPWGLKSLTGS